MTLLPSTWSTIGGEALVIVAIAIVLLIVIKLTRNILKLVFGIIANSVLGLIVVLAVNYLFNLGIPFTLFTVLPLALFGLPGAGTLIILRAFGVAL